MEDILTMYRKTLEDESKMLGTPNSCTINRAMELVASAYTLGKLRLEEDKLREKYAGLAMQAMISSHITMDRLVALLIDRGDEKAEHLEKLVADRSVAFADAMIEALKK